MAKMKVNEQKMVDTSIGRVPLYQNVPFFKDHNCNSCGDPDILIRRYTDILSARNVITGSYELVYSIRHYCDNCARKYDLDILSGGMPRYPRSSMAVVDADLIGSHH